MPAPIIMAIIINFLLMGAHLFRQNLIKINLFTLQPPLLLAVGLLRFKGLFKGIEDEVDDMAVG